MADSSMLLLYVSLRDILPTACLFLIVFSEATGKVVRYAKAPRPGYLSGRKEGLWSIQNLAMVQTP